jgi:hypothetical protein
MSGALPGHRLLRIAERWLDRATFDRVVVPAVADLQHECQRAAAAGLPSWFIRARAYWGVLGAIVLCAAHDAAIDRDGAGRALGRRLLILLLPLIVLNAAAASGELIGVGSRLGAATAIEAGLLLLLPGLVTALPVAFYFAVALHRPRARLEGLYVVALSAVCVVVLSALMFVIVPTTNQAYRVTLFEAFQRENAGASRPLHVPKGVTEMTLPELNDHIAHPPSVALESLARRHRHQRFAFVASVPVLGFVGLMLARRGSSRPLTFAVAFALLGVYYAGFDTVLLRPAGIDTLRPWAAPMLLLLVGFGLFALSPRTRSPEAQG